MSLNQKSFQEDKVAMLCVLYIHHPPWILPPSYFSPSNVKNGAGSHQSKRKTVFQFLILFLKVVVLVRIAVRELIDLNFSVGQLLTIGIKKQSGKCNSLYPMLAFMIFS